jgi:hypothetical protein
MSTALGVDADRREKWNHILEHLSGFATQEKDGRTVFRYSEKGTPWWPNNSLGVQHIYPAGAIGLDSDPKLIEIAHNTIDVMGRWKDFNGMSSFFPAAVRVGYDPVVILDQLRRLVTQDMGPNGFVRGNPHAVENCSIVPNTINEMLCMGHQNVLRVFPVWPRENDARFGNLRAQGAFLVSSELSGGQVQYVQLLSEQGRQCTIENPWPGQEVRVYYRDNWCEPVAGDRFTLETAKGEQILLGPKGVSAAELRQRIRRPTPTASSP